ncbi:hypothetical protein ACFQPA_12085 [Halomarina halobia]|uniref:DUF8071 domain-containing protein n=1 Tax=Halomarina halobia TaxID=3033386 RepID=A0ABD6A9E9_9EURY|nr:hypothetical protein [Halomarina sp. PSR21]
MIAITLLIFAYLFWAIEGVSSAAYDLSPIDVIGGGLALLLLLATIQAYYNDGLLISWLLVFLPVFGTALSGVGVGLIRPTPMKSFGLAIGIALFAALTLGTVGFLLGTAIRRGFKR